LIDRVSAYRGREIQVEHNKTVCAGCSVGCSVDILTRDNTILRIEGAWEGIVNKGIICKVGRFIPLNEERERIHTPLVKKDGKLKAATWDEALEVIAKGMKPLMGKKNLGVAASI
jgi:formate dehydrogenase major subunit